MCGSRQLQHGGTLPHTQARERHHLPVRELKCIVMAHGVVHVDLPEAREPLFNFLVWENAEAERWLAIFGLSAQVKDSPLRTDCRLAQSAR
jgi:hypothetical protein